jgi:hypothetical protein
LPQFNTVGGPTFTKAIPPGQAAPVFNGGWAVEIGLDVQWAHAIAPYANILLVECQNNSGDSLFAAEVDGQPYQSGVNFAENYPGVVVVSNSYGGGEFVGETAYDSEFATSNVAITYSTGDSGAPGEYPAHSPNVVAIGGTSLYTLSGRGAYGREDGWSGSGGGPSLGGEPVPTYQSANGVNFGARANPDISMDADPNTGALVYYSPPVATAGFYAVGGTSLSAPMFAGVIALAAQVRAAHSLPQLNSVGILNLLYSDYNSVNYLSDFHDVTTGSNGFPATAGYDLVTGIGSPKVQKVVPLLSGGFLTSLGGPTIGQTGQGTGGGATMGGRPNGLVTTLVSPALLTTPAAVVVTAATAGQAGQQASTPVVMSTATVLPSRTTLTATSNGSSGSSTPAPAVTVTDLAPVDLGQPVRATDALTPKGDVGAPVVEDSDTQAAIPATDAVFADYASPVIADDQGAAVADDEGGLANLAMVAGAALVAGGSWYGSLPKSETRKVPALPR